MRLSGKRWHPNLSMFGPAGDEQGQGQPSRVSESRPKFTFGSQLTDLTLAVTAF